MKSVSFPQPRVHPERTVADWVLGSLGASAATVSAFFAVVMVVGGPLTLMQRTAATSAPSEAAIAAAPNLLAGNHAMARRPPPGPAAEQDLDFTPVGSIKLSPQAPVLTAAATDGGTTEPSEVSTVDRRVASVVLRDVFDGKALVEERNRLRLIQPGSVLQDAGEVLAIRKDAVGWLVETRGGLIR